jgi:hypothetical protein
VPPLSAAKVSAGACGTSERRRPPVPARNKGKAKAVVLLGLPPSWREGKRFQKTCRWRWFIRPSVHPSLVRLFVLLTGLYKCR